MVIPIAHKIHRDCVTFRKRPEMEELLLDGVRFNETGANGGRAKDRRVYGEDGLGSRLLINTKGG